jgi:hypothetical protein
MRKHNTEQQKEQRRNAYWLLRNVACLSVHQSMVLRDWTDNKILMIINKQCNPIIKW